MKLAAQILQTVFGYDAFRPPQDQIIETVIAGGDALVLMPTGGGKSLCYQIPALARPGCGVVISPLIALMQDQVNALRQLGVRARGRRVMRPTASSVQTHRGEKSRSVHQICSGWGISG